MKKVETASMRFTFHEDIALLDDMTPAMCEMDENGFIVINAAAL